MFSLLREFMSRAGLPVRVILMDDDPAESPAQFRVDPGRVLWAISGGVVLLTVLLVGILLLTPMRTILPGYTSDAMQRNARLNDLRIAALEDSLAVQDAYLARLRDLMLGNVDTSSTSAPSETFVLRDPVPAPLIGDPSTEDWEDHEQPALPIDRLDVPESGTERVVPASSSSRFLAGLTFPMLPPVSGLVSRGFDARTGHFAIDIVVEEGSVVRSVGDGYVIVADWTHDGGQIIAVQHADGYISIYKHNSSLLKRVGDAVRSRDAIALSGNSGEITTGPHLHFELWHNGLAQDPGYYLIDL
ncbi:MAG: M23 family metallopeptidase [Rhodothermales bacterium]|nr:M23 family metallopeptidase [Rhodothermales bacterium]